MQVFKECKFLKRGGEFGILSRGRKSRAEMGSIKHFFQCLSYPNCRTLVFRRKPRIMPGPFTKFVLLRGLIIPSPPPLPLQISPYSPEEYCSVIFTNDQQKIYCNIDSPRTELFSRI